MTATALWQHEAQDIGGEVEAPPRWSVCTDIGVIHCGNKREAISLAFALSADGPAWIQDNDAGAAGEDKAKR